MSFLAAFIMGIACAFLQPNQPQSMIGSGLLFVSISLLVKGENK